MGAVQDARILVFEPSAQQKWHGYGTMSDIRAGDDNGTAGRHSFREPPQHIVRLHQVLKDIEKQEQIRGPHVRNGTIEIDDVSLIRILPEFVQICRIAFQRHGAAAGVA